MTLYLSIALSTQFSTISRATSAESVDTSGTAIAYFVNKSVITEMCFARDFAANVTDPRMSAASVLNRIPTLNGTSPATLFFFSCAPRCTSEAPLYILLHVCPHGGPPEPLTNSSDGLLNCKVSAANLRGVQLVEDLLPPGCRNNHLQYRPQVIPWEPFFIEHPPRILSSFYLDQ